MPLTFGIFTTKALPAGQLRKAHIKERASWRSSAGTKLWPSPSDCVSVWCLSLGGRGGDAGTMMVTPDMRPFTVAICLCKCTVVTMGVSAGCALSVVGKTALPERYDRHEVKTFLKTIFTNLKNPSSLSKTNVAAKSTRSSSWSKLFAFYISFMSKWLGLLG